MNERILDICIEAGINTWPFNEVGFISLDESELVKFAELIVRECIAQCESQNTIITTATGTTHWGQISDAVEQIKQHFGVKE